MQTKSFSVFIQCLTQLLTFNSASNLRFISKLILKIHTTFLENLVSFSTHSYCQMQPHQVAGFIRYILLKYQPRAEAPPLIQIAFVLDSGASVSKITRPANTTLAKLLKIEITQDQSVAKTLLIANEPNHHFVTITCHNGLSKKGRYFIFPFTITNIIFNFCNRLLRKNKFNFVAQIFTMNFKSFDTNYSTNDTLYDLCWKRLSILFLRNN